MQEAGSEGGRRGYISHTHTPPCVAIPGKPSARLTHHLRLVTRQRFLRYSILKETPVAPQNDAAAILRLWKTTSPRGVGPTTARAARLTPPLRGLNHHPMQAFGRNQTSASADQGGAVSDESATGNRLIPSTAPMISSLLRGRRNPSKPAGALHLWGYCRNPMAFRRRFMALGKWLRL
jgi:hypothetical protein